MLTFLRSAYTTIRICLFGGVLLLAGIVIVNLGVLVFSVFAGAMAGLTAGR